MRRIVIVLCAVVALVGVNLALFGCQKEEDKPGVESGLTADSKPTDAQREQMRKSRMPPASVMGGGGKAPAPVPAPPGPPGPK